MEIDRNCLIQVRSLTKDFVQKTSIFDFISRKKPKILRAVKNVSFEIAPGETLGLVGESGCGKSTLGRCLLKLYPPTSGRIFFQGQDVWSMNGGSRSELSAKMQMIFQDPYSSLNPRMTVYQMISESLRVHKICQSRNEIGEHVDQLLLKVGLARRFKHYYPFAFSGGQRQRISIARALSVHPIFIVADEPTSALDVSIQAQILNLMMDLQEEFKLTYLFISHDLNVVRYISHRIAVMYVGELVEVARSEDLFANPLHPYTRALLSAIPKTDPGKISLEASISGDPPNPYELVSGCRFQSRCPSVMDICRRQEPELLSIGKKHQVRCFMHAT